MSQELALHAVRGVPLMPSQVEWTMLKEQASMLVKSGMLPTAIKTPEAAIAIALKGRELGIPMMQAFAHIHIINGKPTISSELMLALIFKNVPGATIDYPESTDKRCVIEAKRPGGKRAKFSFSIEDAKLAGLLGKGPWISYPGAMLRARTVAIVARALFPDAIMGCSYTPEEMGAVVDEDGEVLDIPSDPALPSPPAPAVIKPLEEPKKPAIRTRMSVGAEIMALAKRINLGDAEMAEWILADFGKEQRALTLEEMERYLETLQREQGRSAAEGA